MKNFYSKTTAFILLISLLACAQDSKKFTYELISNNLYFVKPKFEERMDKIDPKGEFISMYCYVKDQKSFGKSINKIAKSTIDSDKWNKLFNSEYKSGLDILFCPSGKLYRLQFFLQKKHLNILSEDDLYAIYKAFDDSTIDMSAIDFDHPKNPKDTSKSFWSISCSLPAKE